MVHGIYLGAVLGVGNFELAAVHLGFIEGGVHAGGVTDLFAKRSDQVLQVKRGALVVHEQGLSVHWDDEQQIRPLPRGLPLWQRQRHVLRDGSAIFPVACLDLVEVGGGGRAPLNARLFLYEHLLAVAAVEGEIRYGRLTRS